MCFQKEAFCIENCKKSGKESLGRQRGDVPGWVRTFCVSLFLEMYCPHLVSP